MEDDLLLTNGAVSPPPDGRLTLAASLALLVTESSCVSEVVVAVIPFADEIRSTPTLKGLASRGTGWLAHLVAHFQEEVRLLLCLIDPPPRPAARNVLGRVLQERAGDDDVVEEAHGDLQPVLVGRDHSPRQHFSYQRAEDHQAELQVAHTGSFAWIEVRIAHVDEVVEGDAQPRAEDDFVQILDLDLLDEHFRVVAVLSIRCASDLVFQHDQVQHDMECLQYLL
eukprot:scaffold8601_cov180-Ochromonas_danica.AAC.4